jgi:hypothetical protein
VLPGKSSLIESIKNELNNTIYLALFVAALVSMLTGFISEDGFLGWMQGFSIIFGLFILIGLGSANDYMKDS